MIALAYDIFLALTAVAIVGTIIVAGIAATNRKPPGT